ncbi:MAG TPA: tetratricopeptide repeat protein, partial [Candidatus Brocadiia bacterium]|nr:tetratricopeptide repeat protein [Candidatus Brocadiia bacterium]
FAAVVNELLDRYVPRYLCVLSPDVLVTRKWYERLVEAMREKPSAIAIGPVTNASDNGQRVRGASASTPRGLREYAQKIYNKERLRTTRATALDPFCAVFKAQNLRKAGGLPTVFDTIECVRLAARSTQDREALVATGVFVHRCDAGPSRPLAADKARAAEAAAVRDLNAAEDHLASSNPREAAAAAQRVLDGYPGMIEALLVLSSACRQLGQMDSAILHLEKASSLRPNDTHLANELGCLHFTAGNLDKAEALFHDVMRKTEGATSAMLNLGEVYLASNKLKQAGVCAQGVLKAEPANVDARMLMAKIFLTAGGVDQTIEMCQQVLSLSPNHAEATQLLNAIRERLGAQPAPSQT